MQEENVELKENIEREIHSNESLQNERINYQKTLPKLRRQSKNLKENSTSLKDKDEEEVCSKEKIILKKENQIKHLKITQLLVEQKIIQTFCDGKYTNEERACCIALLTECHVSMNKLSDIIETVL